MSTGTQTRAGHLTDAEFSRLLDGAQPGATAEAHLGSCTACREELEAVQSSLGCFRALSTAWAEVEAPRRVPPPARWLRGLELGSSWGAGLAATAITGFLAFWLGAPGQTAGYSPHAPAVRVQAAAPTNAELAQDNDLLQSIDQAVSEPGSPEISALQLAPRHIESRPAGPLTD